eukprot:9384645-Heterocapsa_arctica.AAC.1
MKNLLLPLRWRMSCVSLSSWLTLRLLRTRPRRPSLKHSSSMKHRARTDELERVTFDLEIANVNFAQALQEQERMRVIIDTQPAAAINGDEQEPVDRE